MKNQKLNLIEDSLSPLEKGEIFLNMKNIMGLKVKLIIQATGLKTATVYNGIRLASLPNHIKKNITDNDIPSSTVLQFINQTNKSKNKEDNLNDLVSTEIKNILERKESGEYRNRTTIYDKIKQLKKIASKSKGKNSDNILKIIGFIEEHENMEGILEI